MGEVGLLLGVRREAASPLLHQPRAVSYELTAANAADVLLVRELLEGAGLDEGGVARRLFGDLAYRSGKFKEELAEAGVLLAAERAERRPAVRQQVEVCFATLKRVFRLGETLAKTPVGLVTRIAAKIVAYTYGLYVNRLFGRPWGHIKESWAWNPRNTHLASPVCYAGEYLKPISEPVEEPESLPESHSQFYLRTPA